MRFFASPSASFWRQGWKRSAVLRVDRLAQLLQYRLAVADDGHVDVARRVAHLLGVDVDARDLRGGAEARRQGVADHVIRARAEDDDQIGLAERVVAHRQVGVGVVVGDDAAPLRGRVERDPGLLDKGPHLVPGVRPQDAAARDDDRLPGAVDRVDEGVQRLGLGIGARPDDRPPHIAPIDVGLVDGGVEHVAGEIEIDRAGLAVQRLLEGEVDLLRQALQVVHAVGVFDPAFEGLDLVDLLEDLAAELADRARAAEGYDRAAIDQGIGEPGPEIERAGTARPYAHARPLGHPRIGLRHIGGGLLVAGVDEPDALLDAGRFDIEHRPAHDVEDVLDTLRLQAPGEDVVTRQLGHSTPPDLVRRVAPALQTP